MNINFAKFSRKLAALATERSLLRPRRRIPAKLLVLALAACTSCAVGPGDTSGGGAGSGNGGSSDLPSPTVVNGAKDSTDRFAFVVSVNGNCSGTLVSCRHVLTAAHCVCSAHGGQVDDTNCLNSSSVKFRSYTGNPDKTITASKVFVNSGFVQIQTSDGEHITSSTHDLAMLTLDDNAPEWAIPANLSVMKPGIGQVVEMVGYGNTSCHFWSNIWGDRYFGENVVSTVPSGDVACIEKTADDSSRSLTWKGDSGGALLDFNDSRTLLGVTSYGTCDQGLLSGDDTIVGRSCFTRTDLYNKWIVSALGGDSLSCGSGGGTGGSGGGSCLPVHDHETCSGGNLYWYDSCNKKGSLAQNCGGCGCSNDACQPCGCQPQPNAYVACSGANLYWYDSCGTKGSLAQNCGGCGCSNDACQSCASPSVSVFPNSVVRAQDCMTQSLWGFSPNGTATCHPKNQWGDSTFQLSLDGSGSRDNVYCPNAGAGLGQYEFWCIDNSTGTPSNHTFFTILP